MKLTKYIQNVCHSQKTCLRHNEKWFLIKIICVTRSSLLICRGLGDLRKTHNGSDHMYHAMQMAVARSWQCYQASLHATSNSIGRKKS